jgi:hypothetical protein
MIWLSLFEKLNKQKYRRHFFQSFYRKALGIAYAAKCRGELCKSASISARRMQNYIFVPHQSCFFSPAFSGRLIEVTLSLKRPRGTKLFRVRDRLASLEGGTTVMIILYRAKSRY